MNFKSIITLLAGALLAQGIASAQYNPADFAVPELSGEPEAGQWYTVTPPNATAAAGGQATGLLRKGSENKVFIQFYGGGVSVNEYTAARGNLVDPEHGFYSDTLDVKTAGMVQILSALTFGAPVPENPFKDWTYIVIPYATGDFHAGTGDFPYTGLDGKKHVLHHRGYTNWNEILQMVMPYLGTPEALVITGFSAGGFATALNSDAVIDYFPKTKNVTCFVDAAQLSYKDWRNVAKNVWKAPKRIWENQGKTDDIVLDALTALHKKRPTVKILFGCSVRDYALSTYQHYLDHGRNPEPVSADDGDVFQQNLKQFCAGFQKNIPDGGLFIWDGVPAAGQAATLTHHCIELSGNFFTDMRGHGSFAKWLGDAVNGTINTYGVELLDNDYRSNPEREKIRLYEGAAPGTESWTHEEQAFGEGDDRTYINVTTPELEVFVPENPNGSAMIVCPGGGFYMLSYANEGTKVAKRLNEQGITAFVLKYRTNPFFKEDGSKYENAVEMMIEYFTRFLFPERDKLAEKQGVASEDAEVAAPIDNANNINTQWAYADADRAMAIVRLGAAKWGINPNKIGIMGFSAGSMTAMNQALHHSELTRPNFVGAIYTGVAEGFEVPADAAPLFMCSPVNDIFQPQETFRVLQAWRTAKVPVELHYYSKCGHGYGATIQNASCDLWFDQLFAFMKDVEFIK